MIKWLVKVATVLGAIFAARWATDLSTPQKDWRKVERVVAHWANTSSLAWNSVCVGLTQMTGLDRLALWYVRWKYRRGFYQMEGT